jgi:uronate dehydrogenase
MRIVITGAAGNIGRIATEELEEDHDLVLVDRRRVAGRSSIVGDLSSADSAPSRRGRGARWETAFADADVVLHLAAVLHGASFRAGGWARIRRDNIDATWNVLEAAAWHRVPRVVMGSSGWAIRATDHDREGSAGHEIGIGSDAAPRPLTTYGLSKAIGEIAGRMFVDEGRLQTLIAVRIGHCPPEGRHSLNPWLRRRWIGRRDMASLLRRCVEADVTGYHVVYGVSVPDSPYDLTHTRRLLDWLPEQGAEARPD